MNKAAAPQIGMVVSPAGVFGAESVAAAFQQAAEAGAEITRHYVSWASIQDEDWYHWAGTDWMLQQARDNGLRLSLGFQIIRTAILEPRPHDLDGAPWDDAQLIDAFSEFVVDLLNRCADIVDYVEIGSEVNAYLQNHPDEVGPFALFFSEVYGRVKQAHPNVSIGTCFAYRELREANAWNIYGALATGDHDGFTVYLHNDGFQHNRPPWRVALWLHEIAALVGSRSWVVEEVGWSAASQLGSSDEEQRVAVSALFDYLEWGWRSPTLQAVMWFNQHDIDDATAHQIAGTFGDLSDEDRALLALFLSRFGLRENSGLPRPAWLEWTNRLPALKSTPPSPKKGHENGGKNVSHK